MSKELTVIMPETEQAKQKYYIERVKEMNAGESKKYYIQTFGCQMNGHDSEKLAGMLERMGYEKTIGIDDADIIVINTCCVRESAENRIYGNLGNVKRVKDANKNVRIAVCGCMMQQDTAVRRVKDKYRHVDIIFGTFNLHRFPQLLYENLESNRHVTEIMPGQCIEAADETGYVRESPFKAGVNIMYGCNNFCSYCIVPYVRGRERSRPFSDIVKEVKFLAADGVKEVMLIGQNVNSYGGGLSDEPSFAELLRAVNGVGGIERIRFMTSNPKDLSDDLIEAIAECDKVCKHLHLPLQSGSSAVLKRMNRKYTKEGYLDLARRVKNRVPGIGITTDIIVGFPGETEEDFLDTLDVVSSVGFASAFTFIYSKRAGTPAADMEPQVDAGTVDERFRRLVEALNKISYARNKKRLGTVIKVLAEGENRESGLLTGRADDNSLVHFTGSTGLIGSIVNVKITDVKTFYLTGEATNAKADADDGAIL